MQGYRRTLLAIVLTVISTSALSQSSNTEENPVTAIDIALEPDDIMLTHAKAANTLLLGDIPKGFALDETHTPHITLLQQFVLTKDLDQVYAAINNVIKSENPTTWKLEAIKYYYIPDGEVGLAGIVVKPTEELQKLQKKIISATAHFSVKNGTPSAFYSTQNGDDIQKSLISYVTNFPSIAAGDKFNPHVTVGVGTQSYLDALMKQPFDKFEFSPTGVSVYQLGTFGTARKKLKVFQP